MEIKVSKSVVKKEAINILTNEMLSPFAVLNAINKNRKDQVIMSVLNQYGITEKLELSDLCALYDYSDRNIFCKLRKINNKKVFAYCEYKQIKLGNSYYEFIPIRFTISDFFCSLESSLKIKKEIERKEEMYTNLFNKSEQKKQMKAEKRAKRIAEKAKELSKKYTDVPENILLQLAEEFLKTA